MKTTARKTLWSVLLVAVIGGLAAVGAFSAFSDTTSNANNSFATGTVTIGNNATSPLYSVSNATPGQTSTDHCIKITYTGSLPATVKLYRSAFTGGTTPNLSPYITLVVTKGTGTQENCSDFSGSTSIYNNLLSTFATDWTGGIALTNGSGNAAWGQNDAVTYKFSATVADDNNAIGLSTGTHSFTWEARNN
jgi:predicted ribosomally synthesized peptide with SipW-like signal peptide